ncbi:hypothetical protein JGUZn3_00080 [Entomobacter blattae]|uniref:Uncharacterized protein n=1 Tax=Entomobacter blattae TaxID=2762277 RepID=A0A7H1NNB5_9PROT|nr:hypothetical protein JGUZn3_00080 [Entomobacter blattae]
MGVFSLSGSEQETAILAKRSLFLNEVSSSKGLILSLPGYSVDSL